jgi:nucleoside-diphosphate-sugar epimerase
MNIGNPTEISVKQLAEEIIEITESKSVIEYKSLPNDDPKQRCPDITKAQLLLNWAPRIPRKPGVRETIIYFTRELLSEGKLAKVPDVLREIGVA